MIDCDNLLHPLHYDIGTSQRQRVMPDLLSGVAKIDARDLADLLEYFTQLSSQVKYHGSSQLLGDWRLFFRKSIPFTLASIIKYKNASAKKKFENYNRLFTRYQSKSGLQLLFYHIYSGIIQNINNWHLEIKGSGLQIEEGMEFLLRDKLRQPIRNFISLANTANSKFGIRRIDFSELMNNPSWELDIPDLHTLKNLEAGKSKRKQMRALQVGLDNLAPSFFEALIQSTELATKSLGRSFIPLQEELQKNHSPHLGLLYAFIRLFRYLQNDLNKFTRKHLDFFYQDVLHLKPRESVADKAHIVFEIQNQLKYYLLKKDLLVKDGKDNNKAEMLFSLDDEIVVNKTVVKDKRTLFLNNKYVYYKPYLEGSYIARDATKADGIDKDFTEDPKNWSTLGSAYSKFIDPEYKFVKKYPGARIGFVLASPVLLLNEAKRTITTSLLCKLNKNCLTGNDIAPIEDPVLFPLLQAAFKKTYVIVDKAAIRKAEKEGIKYETLIKLCAVLPDMGKLECCNEPAVPVIKTIDEILTGKEDNIQLTLRQWKAVLRNFAPVTATEAQLLAAGAISKDEQDILKLIFPEQRFFNLSLSGEKEWIFPSEILRLNIKKVNNTPVFKVNIKCRLQPDKPAVTFYNKDVLGEDLNTTLPVLKVEINDRLKIFHIPVPGVNNPKCCLATPVDGKPVPLSSYYFFRNLTIINSIPPAPNSTIQHKTIIQVSVKGARKLIVKNDEGMLSVNSDMFPFGPRPKVESNFFIGSPEALLKNWTKIRFTVNWKDISSPVIFEDTTPVPNIKKDFFFDYYSGYQDITKGIDQVDFKTEKFKFLPSYLFDGGWIPSAANEKLFIGTTVVTGTQTVTSLRSQYSFQRTTFTSNYRPVLPEDFQVTEYDISTRNGFFKFTLKDLDFQHERYSYILARQMFAFGKLPEIVHGAAYFGLAPGDVTIPVLKIDDVFKAIQDSYELLHPAKPKVDLMATQIDVTGSGNPLAITAALFNAAHTNPLFPNKPTPPYPPPILLPPPQIPDNYGADRLIDLLHDDFIEPQKKLIDNVQKKGVIIPKEPWTPVIREISMDYSAIAEINDIDYIHLYPYAGTYKYEDMQSEPELFPHFCDEGTLFLGLENLIPGNNINILFQLAEATADSESAFEDVKWHYLENNTWKLLRDGFEILEDATRQLTVSGIIKFALPGNMTTGNTVMPGKFHWIKASIGKNTKAVSETIGIHTQAIQVTFTNQPTNDKLRMDQPLPAESITKLQVADAAIKKVAQPYDSFGGRVPEIRRPYYTRVSELLRHKGKAIQKWDYERLVLEAFPQLYKVKCINHSYGLDAGEYFNDFPVAPGYVLVAVIPDLIKLKAGRSFEPKAPVSVLKEVQEYLKKRTSPFVRLLVKNPRYEKVHLCIHVRLVKGKEKNYYREKLKEDLREFLAPWAVGVFSKLSFGQVVSRSDIIQFVETRDYVDFILELKMRHDAQFTWPVPQPLSVLPRSPRSILFGGDIEICIDDPDCPKWKDATDCPDKYPFIDYCK